MTLLHHFRVCSLSIRRRNFIGSTLAVLAAIIERKQGECAGDEFQVAAPDGEPIDAASPTLPPELQTPFQGLPPEEAKASLQWVIYLIQQNLPPHYEKRKGWGATKKVYAGVDIDNDGLRLETHRRYRDVRHGKWLRYEVDLNNPTDPRNLKVEVVRAETLPDGRLMANLRIDAKIDINARQERWNYGFQLYSVSVKATARLQLTLETTMGFVFDYTRVPPDIVFDPIVDSASIKLVDLEVDRISKLGSDVAEEFGDIVERALRDDYLPKQGDKLAGKLNVSIARRRDKLRISASDWLTQKLKST